MDVEAPSAPPVTESNPNAGEVDVVAASPEDVVAASDFAMRLEAQGRDLEALDHRERALEYASQVYGVQSQEVQLGAEALVVRCNQLAMKHLSEDDFDTSYAMLRKAEKLSDERSLLASDEWLRLKLRAATYNNFGIFCRRRNKLPAAWQYLEYALAIEMAMPNTCENPAATHLNACAVLSQMSQHETALNHALQALDILKQKAKAGALKKKKSPEPSMLAVAYHNAGVQYEFLGEFGRACDCYLKALNTALEDLGHENPTTHAMRKSYQKCMTKAQRVPALPALPRGPLSARKSSISESPLPATQKGQPAPAFTYPNAPKPPPQPFAGVAPQRPYPVPPTHGLGKHEAPRYWAPSQPVGPPPQKPRAAAYPGYPAAKEVPLAVPQQPPVATSQAFRRHRASGVASEQRRSPPGSRGGRERRGPSTPRGQPINPASGNQNIYATLSPKMRATYDELSNLQHSLPEPSTTPAQSNADLVAQHAELESQLMTLQMRAQRLAAESNPPRADTKRSDSPPASLVPEEADTARPAPAVNTEEPTAIPTDEKKEKKKKKEKRQRKSSPAPAPVAEPSAPAVEPEHVQELVTALGEVDTPTSAAVEPPSELTEDLPLLDEPLDDLATTDAACATLKAEYDECEEIASTSSGAAMESSHSTTPAEEEGPQEESDGEQVPAHEVNNEAVVDSDEELSETEILDTSKLQERVSIATPRLRSLSRQKAPAERKREMLSRIMGLGTRIDKLQGDIAVEVDIGHQDLQEQRERMRQQQYHAVLDIQRVWRGHVDRQRVKTERQARLDRWAAERKVEAFQFNAASAMQRAWRCCWARRQLETLQHLLQVRRNECMLKVQSQARSLLAQQHRQQVCSALRFRCCTALQRMGRGLIARAFFAPAMAQRLQERRERYTAAVYTIQRCWRGHVGRCRYRRLKAERDQELTQRKAEYAALRIQTCYRRHTHRAAYLHQKALKGNAALAEQMRLERLNKAEREQQSGAAVIQRGWRCARARAEVKFHHEQKQRRKEAYMDEQIMLYASVRLQAYSRVVLARKQAALQRKLYAEEMAEREKAYAEEIEATLMAQLQATLHDMALVIQRVWRGHRSRQQLKEQRQRQIYEWEARMQTLDNVHATTIQRTWRGLMGRRRAADRLLDRHEEAASMIAAAWHGYIDRRRAERARAQRLADEIARAAADLAHDAAMRIQLLFRQHQARRHIARRRRQVTAVDDIQRVWRGHRGRKRAAAKRLAVQERIKWTRARDNMLSPGQLASQQGDACCRIQRAWRCKHSRQALRLKQQAEQERQARVRDHDAWFDAATSIHKVWTTPMEYSKRHWDAVACVATWYRKTIARRRLSVLRHAQDARVSAVRLRDADAAPGLGGRQSTADCQEQAAVTLQRNIRGYQTRKEIPKLAPRESLQERIEREEREWAAVKLQAFARGNAGRRVSEEARLSRTKANQTHWSPEEEAAVAIQCTWRRRLARKEVTKRRQARHATILLMLEAERAAAATTLQAAQRRRFARELVKLRREEYHDRRDAVLREEAASYIGRTWKMHVAHETAELQRVKRRMEQEAEEWAERRDFEEVQEWAAATIQREWLDYQVRKASQADTAVMASACTKDQQEAEDQHMAAIKIQCAWRGYLARRELGRRQAAAKQMAREMVELDAVASIERCWTYMQQRVTDREALRVVAREKENATVEQRERAALALQRLWRGHQVRSAASLDIEEEEQRLRIAEDRAMAAIQIQAWWRMLKAKALSHGRRYHRNSIKGEKVMEDAATMIQSLWRMHVANKEVARRREAKSAKGGDQA
mmetsp:Transcript_56497/g.100629  ORF Transcript_56497/g.100629 Transcript_56497/m.100629 type:complete len:1798 (-) Transcript_56497:2192-7585(-)